MKDLQTSPTSPKEEEFLNVGEKFGPEGFPGLNLKHCFHILIKILFQDWGEIDKYPIGANMSLFAGESLFASVGLFAGVMYIDVT